ncbi:NAD(P)-dependent alcohol dehydrogenase [Aliikangiella sp. IMCC44359]|uniref:NAD(P)-dependent alcohol dehydrogenase n=1 Tax=Aliikangiella sp. IMCC44359 TaxID=3459125 RepID=UPI00403B2554
MKAVVFKKYGTPEVLQIKELDKPIPKSGEVLVKICATAVNDYDWCMVRGKPYFYRVMFGLFNPKQTIPGMELAGIVESVGQNVSSFKKGDKVYGDISAYGFGSFAEYVCVNEKALMHKPDCISFEQAASIPHASILALQGLVEIGKIKKGQSVLINGAGGGVGMFGLQIAKLNGATEVTGVDTGEKLVVMKQAGFNKTIDYRKKDFTKNGHRYDLILDTKTNRSVFSYWRALAPGGTYVTVGGGLARLLLLLVWSHLVFLLSKKKFKIVALKANKGMDYISLLIESGELKTTIDGPYPLNEISKAMQRFGDGQHIGKVIVSL